MGIKQTLIKLNNQASKDKFYYQTNCNLIYYQLNMLVKDESQRKYAKL